jgi:hypothetical protein
MSSVTMTITNSLGVVPRPPETNGGDLPQMQRVRLTLARNRSRPLRRLRGRGSGRVSHAADHGSTGHLPLALHPARSSRTG